MAAPPQPGPSKLRGALVGLGVLGAIWGVLAVLAWLLRAPKPGAAADGGAPVEAEAGATDAAGARVVDAAGARAADAAGARRVDAGAARGDGAAEPGDAAVEAGAPAVDAGADDGGDGAGDGAVAVGVTEPATDASVPPARAWSICAGDHARVSIGALGRAPRAVALVACRGVAHAVELGADGTPRIVATLDEPDAEAGQFEIEARPVLGDVTGDGLDDAVVGCSRLSERGGPRLAGAWVIPGVRGPARVADRPVALGPVTATSLALAQLDGRSGLEVVVGHMGNWYAGETNEVRLFRGGARPVRSATLRTDGTESVSAVAADLTRDGKRDLVVVHEARGGLTVFAGDGRGGIGDARSFPDVSANGAWVVDLEGDGHEDVLLEGNATLSLLSGDASEIAPPRELSLPRERVTTPIDLDGDAATDLVIALGTDTFLGPQWWDIVAARSRRDGTFELRELVRSAFHPIDLAVGDVDGDGALDLAWLSVERRLGEPGSERVLLTIVTRLGERSGFEGPRAVAELERAEGAPTIALR